MRFDSFLAQHQRHALVVIEMGAGTAIPTIRYMSERIGQHYGVTVIRINPREAHIPVAIFLCLAGQLKDYWG